MSDGANFIDLYERKCVHLVHLTDAYSLNVKKYLEILLMGMFIYSLTSSKEKQRCGPPFTF